MFRFTITRNPYTRILSCYFDKILSERRTQFLGLGLKNYVRNRQLDFSEFLSLVSKQSPEEMDVHWRPQVDLVQPSKINYGAIGRVETLNQDLATILSKIGAVDEAEAQKNMPWTPRASRELERFIGLKERDIIRQVYAEDFRVFGYSTSLPHLT